MYCPDSIVEGGLVAEQVGVRSSDNPKGCPVQSGTHSAGAKPDDSASQSQIMAWYQAIMNTFTSQSSNYCQFRDNKNDAGRALPVSYTFHNDTGASLTYNISLAVPSGRAVLTPSNPEGSVDAHKSKTVTFTISGVGNYNKGDGNVDAVTQAVYNAQTWSCITRVIDDDNTVYIGRRNRHPYNADAIYKSGENWPGNPHCYARDCAYE